MIFARRVTILRADLAPPLRFGEGAGGVRSGLRFPSAPNPSPQPPPRGGEGGQSRKRDARRAVRSFLLAVAVAHLGLAVALDTARPHWRDPEWGHRSKHLLAPPDPRPLMLALGTSRTQMGLNPAVLNRPDVRVFNLGQAGATPRHQWLNYHRARQSGVRPTAVWIEIMPATLATDGGAELLFGDQLDRLSAADVELLLPHCGDPVAFRSAWLRQRAAAWSANRSTLLSHWSPGLLPWRQRFDFQWRGLSADGWLPYLYDRVGPADRERLTAPARQQYAAALADLRVSPAGADGIRDLIRDARADGAAVLVYRMPEGPTFRGWYSAESRRRVDEFVSGLGVPVIDATDWLPDEVFGDGHHLTPTGATAFSERLGRQPVFCPH